VDQLLPELAALMDYFRFLPSWCLDDIMVSFANNGGGVGPHFDQYDVFLLQGQGKRRWQIGPVCDSKSELLPNTEMAILKHFDCQQEYLLEAGDVLYLPPKIAHWGTAVGDCMTYSIGFRAPSIGEVLSGFCDDRLEHLDLSTRIRDKNILGLDDGYCIPDSHIDGLRSQLLATLDDNQALAHWFGRFATSPRYSSEPEKLATEAWKKHTKFTRVPSSRLAYYPQQAQALLFANGEAWTGSLSFVQKICRDHEFYYRDLLASNITADDLTIFKGLVELGVFTAED